MKGENSLKLFGDDIDMLVAKAGEISDVMAKVPGIADLGVFQETGQPELLISINRGASARYGLMAADVDAAVQAAIGGMRADADSGRRPALRFRDPLPAAVSHDAGGDPEHPAAHAGWQQRSAGASGGRLAAARARS